MTKLVVIKNSYLDILCQNKEAFDNANNDKIVIVGKQIEFTVQRLYLQNKESNGAEVFATTSEQDVKVTIPTEEILEKTGLDETAEWVCYQTSFMKANPIAGYPMEAQYYFKDQAFIQVGTLDNTGRRLIDSDGLMNSLKPFKIEFFQTLDKENFWFDGQTICAHFDGNDEDFSGQSWSDEKINAVELKEDGKDVLIDCKYDYNFEDNNSIICSCTNLHNWYYTIITDISREENKPPVYQNETHSILLAVLIPLIFIGLVLPIIMIYLDSQDYQYVEDNFYPVDDLMIAKL